MKIDSKKEVPIKPDFTIMKKTTKRKAFILLSIGILITVASPVFSQYYDMSDLAKGSFGGIGIGLLLTALILRNFETLDS